MNLGHSILGRTTLDQSSQDALTAAMQAFELIISKNPSAASGFLTRMTNIMPELQAILHKYNLGSFKDTDFRDAVRKGARKGSRVVNNNLGDIDPQGDSGDVVSMPHSDNNANPIG